MKELHFESVEHFSTHIKSLSVLITEAGFTDIGKGLESQSMAFEAPTTGCYQEIFLTLKQALSNREFSTNK